MTEYNANAPGLGAINDTWVDKAELPRLRRSAKAALLGRALRALRPDEIERLDAQGNWARDWGAIRVVEDFIANNIYGNRFEGAATLGHFEGDAVGGGPSGILGSTLSDCWIASGARVADCRRLARCFIGERAAVENVGRLELRGADSVFGNDLELFKEELFSRRMRAAAEFPFGLTELVCGPDLASTDGMRTIEALNAGADEYAARLRSDRCFVAPGARIAGASIIENCWIGPHVEIDGAGALRDSTFWGAPEQPTLIRDGANVRRALVGPGCVVEANAYLESSILFECVHVGHQATVKGSAVGPNSRLCGGETNDCLLGPFTISLHQGLILGAYWPEGKGNIAYGANVGSNHTGRAPDQEIFPGEGVFFGLGCSVKFPSNFREAPYSILATGVVALPQKVSFPFSLIATPSGRHDGVSAGLNEISPGWALTNNPYGLERQERNQFQRDRARRTGFLRGVLRPDLIDAMARAGARLEIPPSAIREVYSEAHIAGLGKNFMAEAARQAAMQAYAWGARAATARCLLMAMDQALAGEAERRFAPAEWNKELLRWAAERLGGREAMIDAALKCYREWAGAVRKSKERDDRRGAAIIDDYAERHVSADRDPIVLAVDSDLRRFEEMRDRFVSLAASRV